MGVLKKIGGKRYETHVVSVSKTRANKIKKSLKKQHGKKIKVRVQKTPKTKRLKHIKGQQYDVWRTPRKRKTY